MAYHLHIEGNEENYMLGQILTSQKNAVLVKSLDARMARNSAITNNIANAETPGFKRTVVKFEESLASAINGSKLKGSTTSGKHIRIGRGNVARTNFEVFKPNDATLASGVNNVDIDREMADLAENQIGFKYSVSLLKNSYKKINAAIKGKAIQG
jgi:flagellar basal-body rod protein FlgB